MASDLIPTLVQMCQKWCSDIPSPENIAFVLATIATHTNTHKALKTACRKLKSYNNGQ